MKFEATKSKQVAWARYQESTRELEIDFRAKDGSKASTYRYAEFPSHLWFEFEQAESKGGYFARHIRPLYSAGDKRVVKIWDAKQPKAEATA